jgi:protein-tyrosine phosphatase
MGTASGAFTILTVCSGNICRSPLAELLIRSALGGLVEVSSAGIIAKPGDRMPAEMLEVSMELGVDGSAHRARYLTEADVLRADLVLCMARSHRKAVVELVPRNSRKVFTLLEFDSIAHHADRELPVAVGEEPSARLNAMVDSFRQQRAELVQEGLLTDGDIIDPYRRSRAIYEESVAQLVPAIDTLVRVSRVTSKSKL